MARCAAACTQVFPQSQTVEALVAQAHYNLQVGRGGLHSKVASRGRMVVQTALLRIRC